MKSGKSSHLMEYLNRVRDAKRYSILAFTPGTDNRNDTLNQITNRNSGSWNALSAPRLINNESSSIFILDTIKYKPKPDLVAIDEVQFFDEGIEEVIACLRSNKIEVAVAGLNRDFRGVAFPVMKSLMPLATKTEELTAICEYESHNCEIPATMTQRLIDGKPAPYNSPIVLIEGKGDNKITYQARCHRHWRCPDVPKSRLQAYLNHG